MTLEIEDAALALFIAGPAPYGSGNPAPSYQTAQQELAAALEGQAPHFSKTIADQLGPSRTAELAQVIRRAVAVGIKRRAAQETAELVAGAYDLLVQGLDQVTDGCTTPEDETEPTSFGQAVDQAIARNNAAFVATLCTKCAGTGAIYINPDGLPYAQRAECDLCEGSGKRHQEAEADA